MTEYRLIKPLIHPPGYADENPAAYLIRIAQLNGYKSYRWLFDSEKVPTQAFALQKGYHILGDTDWSGYQLDKKPASEVLAVHFNDMISKRLKYCPLCLQENNYYRVQWQYKPSMACTRHGVWLSHQCEFCQSPVEINNSKIDRCSCGKSFSDAQAEPCSQDVINLQRFLEGEFSSIDSDATLLDSPESLDIVSRIKFIRFILRWIHNEHWDDVKTKQIFSNHDCAREFISDAGEALFFGKVGFISFLEKVYLRRKGLFQQFYQSFYNLFPEKQFHRYRQLIEHYINRYWKRALSGRNIYFSPKTISEHPWIPLQQACREFELHKSTLRSAIEQNLVRSESSKKDRRVVTLIYKPDLIARVVRLRNLLSAKDAAIALGLTKAQFTRLREAEGFEAIAVPVKQGSAKWQFYWDDIYQYRDSLLRYLVEISGDYWTLSQLLQFYGGHIEDPLITILQAIKNNELHTVAKLKGGSGLSSMLFSKSEFLTWYEKRRQESSFISIPKAAKLMGIQQQFAYQLVHSGLLKASLDEKRSSRVLSQENLDRFGEQYVLLSKLAKKAKINSRTLMDYLERKGIYPVDNGWDRPLRQKVYERKGLLDMPLLHGCV